jgi:phosphatidylserine/phosphatidylglycerophosphate/cardiolipin synthase-like enzyme
VRQIFDLSHQAQIREKVSGHRYCKRGSDRVTVADSSITSNTHDGLSSTAYRGDGAVLLAFDLDESLTSGLAGFAIQYTSPTGQSFYVPNRLSLGTAVTAATAPHKLTWTPSNRAPIQKFWWADFPPDVVPGTYIYEITAMYFDQGGGLKAGPAVSVPTEITAYHTGQLEFGFNRGYASSQAYAARFHNAGIRPKQKSIDFDTTPYEAQYEWLGYHARKMAFGFLQECLADPDITVDLFAYDLDEPDFIRGLEQLGGRLRAVLDDAPLHTKPRAMEPLARARLEASAGAANIHTGHFRRFAHNKVLIQKKNGQPTKVLTGSANFSLRGLYIQANNILVFDDPAMAALYEQAFDEAFCDMADFDRSTIAQQWFDVQEQGPLPISACFSPHKSAAVSLDTVSDAIQKAHSSVLYAVMELEGGGPVLDELRNLGNRADIFSYGITQTAKGLNLYKPGETNAVFADFAFLARKVPAPFRAEWSGGLGQVIHHKFVVVDFNEQHPVVFAGSSNLAEGGEQNNGDNLLAIYDPGVVTAYAVEAIRLVDHYHFRVAMKGATDERPLQLQRAGAQTEWWQRYYDPNSVKYHERLLLGGQPEAKG